MPAKVIILNFKDIAKQRHSAKREKLKFGLPLKRRRFFPRDPEKAEALLKWLLRVTPPGRDVLSGKAFSEIYRRKKEKVKGCFNTSSVSGGGSQRSFCGGG